MQALRSAWSKRYTLEARPQNTTMYFPHTLLVSIRGHFVGMMKSSKSQIAFAFKALELAASNERLVPQHLSDMCIFLPALVSALDNRGIYLPSLPSPPSLSPCRRRSTIAQFYFYYLHAYLESRRAVLVYTFELLSVDDQRCLCDRGKGILVSYWHHPLPPSMHANR